MKTKKLNQVCHLCETPISYEKGEMKWHMTGHCKCKWEHKVSMLWTEPVVYRKGII